MSVTEHDHSPYDTCTCGDFRRDHDDRGCVLCHGLGNFTAGMIPPCKAFRLRAKADPAEVHRQVGLLARVFGFGVVRAGKGVRTDDGA
jgi:hypothetical protein